MTAVSATLWVWLMIAGGPVPDLCALMSGAGVTAVPPRFQGAAVAAAAGEFKQAVREFFRAAGELSREAEAAFSGESKGVGAARGLLDERDRTGGRVLVPRQDQLSLAEPVWAWGAWLACRAGRREEAMVLLRSGWRDWGEERLIADGAFVTLALGSPEEAVRYTSEEPGTGAGLAARGAWLCAVGRAAEGLPLLKAAGSAEKQPLASAVLAPVVAWCEKQAAPT